ncbi:MAG: ThiF family adenylyltransferase [Planctomycetaceae bacterium]
MDYSRIENVVDVPTLQEKKVTIFGAGASIGMLEGFARSGVRKYLAIDVDRVGAENMARQGHDPKDIGRFKADAAKAKIMEINPEAEVETLIRDLTKVPEDVAAKYVAGTDIFVAATDSFACQALVNRFSLMLNVPVVTVGIYAGGTGGEAVWTDPVHKLPCFRCLCANRYAAHEQQRLTAPNVSLDPSSQGADIFSVRLIDAIAGQLVLGLLTQGAANRYGRLIEQLGDRQFIQLSMSPEFALNGRDIVREKLQVPAGNEAYVTWNSIALADPDRGQLPCLDCEQLRGHKFELVDGHYVRRIPGQRDSGTSPDAVVGGTVS